MDGETNGSRQETQAQQDQAQQRGQRRQRRRQLRHDMAAQRGGRHRRGQDAQALARNRGPTVCNPVPNQWNHMQDCISPMDTTGDRGQATAVPQGFRNSCWRGGTQSRGSRLGRNKVQTNVWRRELGFRVHAARKARMRRLPYEWLAGLREIVIDPERCPLTFSEFTLKEFEKDKEGNWIDEIPDGNDHSIDAVRYAMMDDVLRG